MAITTTKTTTTKPIPLIAFALPGNPCSVRMARFYVRAALGYHGLGGYAETAELVCSEIISNALQHAGAPMFAVGLAHAETVGAVSIVVTDPSPAPPVMRRPAAGDPRGRGLLLVAALSWRWGWLPCGSGKAVFAILTGEG
jgi:anti-sigma regulatory factor (Ser/Thr protein kinase)